MMRALHVLIYSQLQRTTRRSDVYAHDNCTPSTLLLSLRTTRHIKGR